MGARCVSLFLIIAAAGPPAKGEQEISVLTSSPIYKQALKPAGKK
jgi:hypothetical protein